jgi:serine/threonine-protein kinase HipA
MSESLVVMADGVRMGKVSRDGKRLGFQYDSGWLESERRYPLSLSMPLALKEHPHSVIEPFLWGLLPDNPRILEEWGRRFQVSPHNAFRIISHVGEDCAGAVQFLRDEREHQEATGPRQSRVNWIDDQELSRRCGRRFESRMIWAV